MMKKLTLALFWSILTPIAILAQNVTVNGVVKDDNGNPLQGVTIKVIGKKTITTSDKAGSFAIAASPKDSIQLTYTGFKPTGFRVGNQTSIDLAMESRIDELDEVVVSGYGIQTFRKNSTAASSKIDRESLENTAPVSVSEVLQGRAAGVNIVSNDGSPGSGFSINIRGFSSITAGGQPLVVIDNIPYASSSSDAFNPLASLNPNDIESIDILKDASATALYGVGASNGVIVITTKKGKSGKPNLNYSAKVGFGKLTRLLETLSPQDYALYRAARVRAEGGNNNGFQNNYVPYPGQPSLWELLADQQASKAYIDDPLGTLNNVYGVTNTDGSNWLDLITQNNIKQFHDLDFSGSNGGTSYFAALGYAYEKGNIINSSFKRYTGRLNLDQKLGKILTAGMKVQYSQTLYEGLIGDYRADNAIAQANFLNPFIARDNVTGSSDGLLNNGGNGAGPESPEYRVKNLVSNRKSNWFSGNFNLTAKPTKWLDLVFQGGVITDNNSREYYEPSLLRSAQIVRGRVTLNDGSVTRLVMNPRASFNKTFSGGHKLNATVVYELRKDINDQKTTVYEQFNTEVLGENSLAAATSIRTTPQYTDVRVQSWIGRVQYEFNRKYILTASTRIDQSSRFITDRTGIFPAVSAAWNVMDEDFMKFASNTVSTFKIRAGYGITGNDQIPLNSGLPLGTISSVFYPFNNTLTTAVDPRDRFANSDITWETTKGLNIGLDVGLFRDRVTMAANYYRNVTDGLLLDIQLPGYSGFGSSVRNIGSLQNSGFEFELYSRNFSKKSFTWTTTFNIAFNRNKILDLGGQPELGFRTIGSGGSPNDVLLRVGMPIGIYYGTIQDGLVNTDIERYNSAVKVQDNGTGEFQYFDINGDGLISRDEYVPIGYTLPIHTGGIGNTLNYKGIELYVFARWSYGNDVINNNINRAMYLRGDNNPIGTVVDDIWNRQNQDNNYQKVDAIFTTRINSLFSRSEFVEDGSYLRLETVRLGYSLPQSILKRIKIKGLRFSVTGQNLALLTRYSWYDPEVNTASGTNKALFPGLDQGATPRSRFILFGMDINL